MKFGTLILLLVVTASLYGQKKKLVFHSISNIGILTGEAGTTGAAQTINGLQSKNWFWGVGIGIDPNHFLTYPVFFDVRTYVGKSKKIFFYGDAGSCLVSKKIDPPAGYYDSKYFPGFTNDLVAGYVVKLKRKLSIIISGGYSFKQIKNKSSRITGCPFMGPCSQEKDDFTHSDNRITVKAGIIL